MTLLLLLFCSEDNLILPAIENHYEPIDWTPEGGYPKKRPSHYYPRVSGGTGSRMGLTVIMNVSSEEYYCSKTKCVGFKVRSRATESVKNERISKRLFQKQYSLYKSIALFF